MSFAPRNLLITGGAGFIGTNFVRHWLAKTQEGRVIVFDALTYAGNLDNLCRPRTSIRALRSCAATFAMNRRSVALMEAHQIDTIVHFAAESHVDRSILGPDDFIRTNVVGTHALLKAAKTLWVDQKTVPAHRFHHVSTDEVYGSLGPNDPPFTENSPYAPNSPYSASKAASDHLVRAYHETYGLETTVTNCSNNYGPYHFPEKLIPLTIVNILLGKAVAGLRRRTADTRLAARRGSLRGDIAGAQRTASPAMCITSAGTAETTNIEVVRRVCGLVDSRLSAQPELQRKFPAAPIFNGKKCGGVDHSRA